MEYYPLYNAESLIMQSQITKEDSYLSHGTHDIESENTETNISSAHPVECPHRYPQRKDHC